VKVIQKSRDVLISSSVSLTIFLYEMEKNLGMSPKGSG